MENYNKILINVKKGDAVIIDGDKFDINQTSYSVKDGCLYIVSSDDLTLTIPYGQYQEVKVMAPNGDCVINLMTTKVGLLDFISNGGDLVVHGAFERIKFNSPGGDYVNDAELPDELLIDDDEINNQTWKNGERYR